MSNCPGRGRGPRQPPVSARHEDATMNETTPGRRRGCWARRRRAGVLAVTAGLVLLTAACGGSPSSSGSRSSTGTGSSPSAGGSASPQSSSLSALAFARCMRSHGIPGWPDPTSSGVFDKSELRQLGVSESRVRALEDGACNIPLPSGGQSQGQAISLADQSDYHEAAVCMRRHGFPDFPDPTFQDTNVTFDIPSTIDTSTSRFASARAICERLIPPGLPDGSSSGP
jgi:hypothetical protein